jgi:hypothetical protein
MMFLQPIKNAPCRAAGRLQLATSDPFGQLQLIGIFGFGVSFARDASIGKHSAEEV